MATKKGTTVVNGGGLDVEALRQVVEILEASEVTRLQWKSGGEELFIMRGPPPMSMPAGAHLPSTPAVHVMPAPVPVASHAPAAEARPRPSIAASSAKPPQATPDAPAAEKKGTLVTSPFVGTFYRSPAPDQPSYIEVGSVVKKGQVLCIVEAMKLMNEIESEVEGKVTEILVKNAQPVEFGQALFRVEPP
ncbi:MAG: acetyl-CoA carboxylase biotin carboxyl carrier protein [Myxococcaceae bacterium]